MTDETPDIPPAPRNMQLPVAPGLAQEERVRLDDLKERFRAASYPRMLGLDWAATPPEVDRRVRVLQDWFKEVRARPGLTVDDRSAITFCEAQLEQAHWVLKHPVLGPAYLKAARERAEVREQQGTPTE